VEIFGERKEGRAPQHWDGNRLITAYILGPDQTLRYTYSILPDTKQLMVRVSIDGAQPRSGWTTPVKQVYDAAPRGGR